jgi:hypothetical protein
MFVKKGECEMMIGGAPWTAVAELACLVSLFSSTLRMVFMEQLHIPLSLPLLVLPHAFRQMRLQVQERLRGAFRRKP